MSITKEDLIKGKRGGIKVLLNGQSGTGKTYCSMTFPKWMYACTEPGGLDTARTNPGLLDNMVEAEEFIPSPDEDVKQVFVRMEAFIDKAHSMAKEGKVSTLILDNMSFLSENRWQYINKHETIKTGSGALDTRGMYGVLSRWLYTFTLTKLLSFPGNTVVTCHEQVEGDEAMAKKVDKTTPITSNILGGFREKVGGMFSANIYLKKKRVGENRYEYWARCQPGEQRCAKNRLGLPELVRDVSYNKLIESMHVSGQSHNTKK